MAHSLTLLQKRVEREEIPWISVANAAERTILAFFHVGVGDAHRHLDVGVRVSPAGDEVAFQIADAAHGKLVFSRAQVQIERVLERRAVARPDIDVPGKVDSRVGQIVLLLPTERLA